MYQASSLRLTRSVTWPEKYFDEVASLEYGKALPKHERKEGPYPVMGSNGISGHHDSYLIEGPGIVIGRKGSAGEVTWVNENFYPIDTTYYVKLKNSLLNLKFLYIQLLDKNLGQLRNGAGVPGLNRDDVYRNVKIAVPTMEEQQNLIDEYENVRRMLVDQNLEIIKFFEQKIEDTAAEIWGA
jgi:restriction endonuclease S subunit